MKTKIPSLVTILILTVITSVMWISLSIYREVVVKPTSVVAKEISQSLNPNLDQNTINEIVNRQ